MSDGDSMDLMALSTWASIILVAFVLVVSLLAVLRGGFHGDREDVLLPVGLVLAAVAIGLLAINPPAARDPADQRRALDMRVFELTAQAVMPGSALGCLDAIAGEAVETSCEKALFASPEATAAAVSYVTAQLSLLAAASSNKLGRQEQGSAPILASLRRALEADRFGIVAHVLAVRDGCTADQCKALALLRDRSRVSANLAEAAYDGYVKRHMAGWISAPGRPVAAADVPPATPAAAEPTLAAGAKLPSNLFFPSAASIPPVNIMTAEPNDPPPPQDTTGAAEAKPAPLQKPKQARRPTGQAASPGGPMQLGPVAQ